MADNETNGAGAPAVGPIPGAEGPRMNIISQYVKDFSFENPDGPRVAQNAQAAGGQRINVGINVNATRQQTGDWEVSIKFDCAAKDGERTMFAIELLYCGIARFTNVPDNQVEALAMIEVPRQLFPFARQILADATRNGGFLPLMLDPVDFATMYRQRQQQQRPNLVPPAANLS